MELEGPKYEWFLQNVYDLNPKGDLSVDYKAYHQLMEARARMPDGIPITPQLFYEKYKEYRDWWVKLYLNKEKEGYLAKGDRMKTISEFISLEYHYRTFRVEKDSRDWYLFGDLSDAELRRQKEEAFKYFENRS